MPRLGLGLGLSRGNLITPLYKKLAKQCGLMSYCKSPDYTDKVGKGNRDAVQALQLLGDSQMYGEFGTNFIPDFDSFTIELELETSTLNFEILLASHNTPTQKGFKISTNGTNIGASIGDGVSVGATDDNIVTGLTLGQLYKVRLEFDRVVGVLNVYIDNSEIPNGTLDISAVTGAIGGLVVFVFKRSAGNLFTGKLYKLSVDDYELDITGIDSNLKLQLKDRANNTVVDGQLFLATNPTSVTNKVVSLYDEYGGSISKARGKNLFDGDLEIGDYATGTGEKIVSTTRMRTTNKIYVSPNETYIHNSDSVQMFTIFFYDVDGNFISNVDTPTSPRTFTTPSNCRYITARALAIDLNSNIQIELGATPTPYEPYSGYTYDELGTDPVPQGTVMLAGIDGNLVGVYADGERVKADSTGRVEVDIIPVDGVVGLEKCNYTKIGSTYEINEKDKITVTTLTGSSTRIETDTIQLKPNTLYSIKSDISVNPSTEVGRLSVVIGGIEYGIVNADFSSNTFVSDESGEVFLRLYPSYGGSGTFETEFDNFVIFEGIEQPPSNTVAIGNSITPKQRYNHIFTTDTTRMLTDDVTNENKVYPIVGNTVENEQLFISVDEESIGYTESPLTGDCLVNMNKLMKLNEKYQVQTAEGSGVYEDYVVDGETLYVYKEGVIVK